MKAVAPEKSSLSVDRFRAHYFIASDHPAPENVKRKLDETLHKTLVESLRSGLSRSLSDEDPSIWFVRQLSINLDVNLGWNQEELGHAFAIQFVSKLSHDLKDDKAHGIVRFANRAAYLASFLRDLSKGFAWSQWYYNAFDGVQMLPQSAAMRTAICLNPQDSLAALLDLSANDLSAVIGALSEQDKRRVLTAIANPQPELDESRCFQELLSVWIESLDEMSRQSEAAQTLRLFLEIHRKGAATGNTLKNAAVAFARLAVRLASASWQGDKKIFEALLSGNIADLYLSAGARDAEVLLPLTHCPPSLLEQIWKTLSQQVAPLKAQRSEDIPRHTLFGGMFLLLPIIDRMPLSQWTESWPIPTGEQSPASLIRFIMLLKSFGKEQFGKAFWDPVLRHLLRIDPRISLEQILDWEKRIPRTMLDHFLESLRSWERGQVSDANPLLLIHARSRRQAIGMLLDAERGHWLFGSTYRPGNPVPFIRRLEKWLADTQRRRLIADDHFVEQLREVSQSIEVLDVHQFIRQSTEAESVQTQLKYLPKVAHDVEYLAAPDQLKFSAYFDLTLSIAAQRVLRAFAWSLPGFSKSGLSYLYANFLDFSATLEREAERNVVRVGSPPLNIILAITGIQRSAFSLSWLEEEKPFKLFPAE